MKNCRIKTVLTLAVVAMACFAMTTLANAAPLWTPGEIDSSINVLWLDAADTGTITDTDGAVSQWNDKSGNGNHADIVSAGQEPGTGVNTLNGKNVVNFVAGNDNEIRTTNLPLGASLGDFFVYTVNTPKDISGWHHRWQLGDNGTRQAVLGNTGKMEFTTYGSHLVANVGPLTSGTPFMGGYYASHTDSNAREIWINGANVKSDTNAIFASITTASTGVLLGDFTTATGTNTDMDMAEFIILKGVRDTDTQEKVEGYLAWKWGLQGSLPSGHTYESAAPMIPELDVDAADYIALKTHMGQATSAGATEGDFDGDNDVDWDDLQILQGRFSEQNAVNATPVPEPATLFVMLAAGLPALLKRRRS